LDNAQELLKQPPLTEADLLKRFSAAIQDAVSLGLTSIHDAGLDPVSLDFFKRSVLFLLMVTTYLHFNICVGKLTAEIYPYVAIPMLFKRMQYIIIDSHLRYDVLR
jgi:Predicted metal-dependent hydrolase with the TIM-barrel fold